MKLLYNAREKFFYVSSHLLPGTVINKFGTTVTYTDGEKILSSDISRNQEIINIFEEYIKNNESEYLEEYSEIKIVEIPEGKEYEIIRFERYHDIHDIYEQIEFEEIFISDSPIEKINLEEL